LFVLYVFTLGKKRAEHIIISRKNILYILNISVSSDKNRLINEGQVEANNIPKNNIDSLFEESLL
jgi:hypothetical protein